MYNIIFLIKYEFNKLIEIIINALQFIKKINNNNIYKAL